MLLRPILHGHRSSHSGRTDLRGSCHLRNVAEVAVPTLADICSVSLLDGQGALRVVAIAARDPAHRRLLVPLIGQAPQLGLAGTPAGAVLASSQSTLISEVTDAELRARVSDPERLALLRALELRSMMVVPMLVPARMIGVMSLATARHGRRLGHEDVALGEQLGRRAAVAVENARLHSKLASVAETLGRSLLPLDVPEIPGWEIASLYRPAESDLRIDVGGDFYEFFEQQGRWFGVLGDVGGKGVRAAAITALMRHGARVAAQADPRPSAVLGRLDEALQQEPGDLLCTALCFRLEGDLVRISSAGHPRAMHVDASGALRELPEPGVLLGAFPDMEARPEEELHMATGDLLVLYTDGVIEAPGDDGRFGLGGLRTLITRHAHAGPQAVIDAVEQSLRAFSVAPQRDDVAIVALRRQGDPRPDAQRPAGASPTTMRT